MIGSAVAWDWRFIFDCVCAVGAFSVSTSSTRQSLKTSQIVVGLFKVIGLGYVGISYSKSFYDYELKAYVVGNNVSSNLPGSRSQQAYRQEDIQRNAAHLS